VNIYLNDEDVRYLKGLETPVEESDVVSILPAVAGGAGWDVNGSRQRLLEQ
jgi:molybdopterin converting factor small subunit